MARVALLDLGEVGEPLPDHLEPSGCNGTLQYLTASKAADWAKTYSKGMRQRLARPLTDWLSRFLCAK